MLPSHKLSALIGVCFALISLFGCKADKDDEKGACQYIDIYELQQCAEVDNSGDCTELCATSEEKSECLFFDGRDC
ncbi:MAG: hypothetical protein GY866_19085 [Proteobacteria bacterium]|nr:hypothetical protein [Pseudomonadota bacterium]